MSTDPIRLYGVSHGNGNDGVSHIFANYYVRTNDPWRLAHLALVGAFAPPWQSDAMELANIDGDSDYTVTACIYEPLDSEDNDGSYCDANGAWHITEVFPEDKPREGRPVYESLEEAFTPELLAKVPE